MSPNEPIKVLVRSLSVYLLANPLACDTCDGIRHWWLGTHTAAAATKLQAALDWMVEQGVMERLVAADGHVRFRRAANNAHADQRLRELAALP